MEPSAKPDGHGASASWAYPPALKAREDDQVNARREAVRQLEERAEALARNEPGAGAAGHNAPPQSYRRDDPAPRVGFALSGGGIRSATFSLGVFQALARYKLIRRIDYLSTVSGGGYFGAFLARLISRPQIGVLNAETLLHPKSRELPRTGALASEEGQRIKPVEWLRNHGRYLAPNGGGDLANAAAMAIRNWLALHVVVAGYVLMLFVFAQLCRIHFELHAASHSDSLLHLLPTGFGNWLTQKSGGAVYFSPYGALPLTLAIYLAVPLGWGYWLITSRRKTPFHPLIGAGLTLLLMAIGHYQLGAEHAQLRAVGDSVGIAAALAILSSSFAIKVVGRGAESETQRHNRARNWSTNWLTRVMLVCILLLVFTLIDSLGQTLYWRLLTGRGYYAAGLSAGMAVMAPLLIRASQLPLLLSKLGGKERKKPMPVNALAGLAAVLITGAILVGLNAASHALTWPSLAKAPVAAELVAKPCMDLIHSLKPASICGLPVSAVAVPEVGILPLHLPEDRNQGLLVLALLTGFCVLAGRTWPFLNRSGYHSLYATRLTQAYLGASNPQRFPDPREGQGRVSATEDHDDAAPEEYWDKTLLQGGPLHLINCTINETATEAAQIVLRDRKGIGMAVGPAGLSAGVRHHALHGGPWPREATMPEVRCQQAERGEMGVTALKQAATSYSMFAVRDAPAGTETLVERLYPGQWVAISAAAFTTGLGSHTTAALSLLMGLSNVRLGYWWNSGRRNPQLRNVHSAAWRFLFPVQSYLLDEFMAVFRGADVSRWYLSDGGHFENMGGYELIRRRLPLIVVVDAEADGEYRFEGLSNLVRKARIDLGAEVTFLDEATRNLVLSEEVREHFGSLDELRPAQADGGDGFSTKYAALARVRYSSANAGETAHHPDSWLVYIKPTLHCEDPTDVREYRATHPCFPQESTLDQFFDEAQWESYRKLGEVIGKKIFSGASSADWIFAEGVLREADADRGGGGGGQVVSSA